MKIDRNKCYTLSEIKKNGLLLSLNGQPYTTEFSIRNILREQGIKPTLTNLRKQLIYQVKGQTLIDLNKQIKK